VTSKDGTKIHYRKLGSGDGLILLHGAMMYSVNFMALASFLAKDFTLYVPDRRGRALSSVGVQGLLPESEDLRALITETKAQNVFGLSSGAIIALQTAIAESSVKKIALYEPPIPVKGTAPGAWAQEYLNAYAKEKFGKAFLALIKGTGDPGSLFNKLPGFIVSGLINVAINADAKKERKADEISLKSLLAAVPYDIKIVDDAIGIIDRSKNIPGNTLLIGGEKSQSYLKVALDELGTDLKRSRRVTLPGLGHTAADNGGHPEVVAKELLSFFK
jgi:pimeloyl-ACP methyl ester carboxylesterase